MQKPKSTSWKSGARSLAACLLVVGLLAVSEAAAAAGETLALEKTVQRYRAQKVSPLQLANALDKLAENYESHSRYAEAEHALRRALALREKHLGPADPIVAQSLGVLALFYTSQGQYEKAEPLYKRSLAIRENSFGPEHRSVATSLNNLGAMYVTQGFFAQAIPIYERELAIQETNLGSEHLDVAMRLNNLARLYEAQGQYVQAEVLYKRSLAIWEKALGPEHTNFAQSLNNLAALYYSQGQYSKAEPLYGRALTIREKALGSEHPNVAESLNNLAALYFARGQYAEAEPIFKRALAIEEKVFGPEDAHVATSLNNLGELYKTQGHYVLAEPLLKRALAISEKAHGPHHPYVALALKNLAALYLEQGQYAQAEPLYRRALAIRESTLGPNHPDVASSLNALAALYHMEGQYAQAEPFLKRALAVFEKALGPEHPDVALSLNNLASLYLAQDRYSAAEPLYERALAIREKTLGSSHPRVSESLLSLASLYQSQRKYTQAENLYKRSLLIFENAYGGNHPDVARSLNNLASLYSAQGQYAQAEACLERSLAINENVVLPSHPSVALSLNNLAELYVMQGQYERALAMVRRASAIYQQRIVAGGTGDTAIREATKNRAGFQMHLSLLSLNPGKEPIDKITDESFHIVQLEQASGTAVAIAKMAARFAGGDEALAGLIKRKQDVIDQRTKGESLLVSAAGKHPQARNTDDEQRLRDEIGRTGKDIETINDELDRRFPEYRELTRVEPASVDQTRKLLRQGEALLVYSLSDNSFVWVVRPDRADFMPLRVDVKDIAAKVAAVRAEMELDAFGVAPRVSVQTLHSLYQSLFAPAMSLLAGIKHVMVVPAGPLQSLPFGMLIASPPPEIRSDGDYRQIDWLAKHFAFSVLPSVSSIRALRQFSKKIGSQEPFAGFGDPLIGETSSTIRGTRAKVDVASAFPGRSVKVNAPTSSLAPEIADVEAIRQTPRLPETANELRAIGKALKASPDAILLQENANETRIKGLDLSKYRTIAFATHGMMAGEIDGVSEPGLILTPPQQGTIEDDGYLSAGEIARLKLNADWVILSACNTAAADGTPGAEGLSGLAKAFFYAGARSLLVSNWYVESEAAVRITTETLKRYADNPAIGKAEALRQTMQELRDDPEFSHPIFWAPFSVVGEGGSQ